MDKLFWHVFDFISRKCSITHKNEKKKRKEIKKQCAEKCAYFTNLAERFVWPFARASSHRQRFEIIVIIIKKND